MVRNNELKYLVILLILVILIAGGLLGYKVIIKSQNNNSMEVSNQNIVENVVEVEELVELPVPKEVQIFKGNDRPFAVMIDNHDDARPQVGINDAFVVYEIIVEGGFTRMMPIFKGADLDEIGPIRSARHYYLDYALEHDAIYVHYGESPQADYDISALGVTEIDGIYQSTSDFWRTKGKYAPHNVLTSTSNLKKIAENKNYSITSDKKSVLNYTAEDVDLTNGQGAIEVYIPYSNSQSVTLKYDEEKQNYVKYANGKKQTDWKSEEDIAFKNIIITFCKNYTLNDPENKGRQGLNNVGILGGYYITNGKAIKITCDKESRNAQTVYKDLEGNEIQVSDGNTYISICPIEAKVIIEEPEEAEETIDVGE